VPLPSPLNQRSTVRPEIQAARAAAVLMVVLYHLWPERLPGGYVGVDVFFVISGFLITGHLLREAQREGRVRLALFWARRMRRLLPAALLVLTVSAALSLAFLPQYQWEGVFQELLGATVYVVNWVLAANAVDYLAAHNAPSPVQHYWSLSVEEQFYLVWPLLAMLAIALASRWWRGRTVTVFRAIVVAVILGSLLASIVVTAQEPALAYFATYTRAWEFGAGALLATFAPVAVRFARTRALASWLGFAVLAVTAFAFTATTPFPSFWAAIPVAATVLVIWAGTPSTRLAPTPLVRWRPVQWLGDISYSVYLWHWPLIVFYPHVVGKNPSTLALVAILGVTVLFGWLSYRFVEQPGRGWRWLTEARPRRTYAVTATVTVLALILPVVGYGTVLLEQQRLREQERTVSETVSIPQSCFGALALDGDRNCLPATGPLVPSAGQVATDRAILYNTACQIKPREFRVHRCTFGTEGGPRVLLLGDSHAASWFPALHWIAQREGWQLDVHFKSSCSFGTFPRVHDGAKSCYWWQDEVAAELASADPYDLIFVGHYSDTDIAPYVADSKKGSAMRVGFRKLWRPLVDRGSRIVAFRDTPEMRENTATCVEKHWNDPSECAVPRAKAVSAADVLQDALRDHPDLGTVLDLNDYFCDATTCHVTAGGVVIWRDQHHFTATYSLSLAPVLWEALQQAGLTP